MSSRGWKRLFAWDKLTGRLTVGVDKSLKHKAKLACFLLSHADMYEIFFEEGKEEYREIAFKVAKYSKNVKFLTARQYSILAAVYVHNETVRKEKGLPSIEQLWTDYIKYKRNLVA
jgi:16S rRNA C1402 N4-methylase RsmH